CSTFTTRLAMAENPQSCKFASMSKEAIAAKLTQTDRSNFTKRSTKSHLLLGRPVLQLEGQHRLMILGRNIIILRVGGAGASAGLIKNRTGLSVIVRNSSNTTRKMAPGCYPVLPLTSRKLAISS